MQKILTYPEWIKVSGVLSAGTGKAFKAAELAVWYDCLCDIPCSTLQAACIRALQESETGFLPPIGLIRRLASETSCGLLPQASQEWDHVRNLVRSCGYMRKGDAMRAMSPLTQQAVKAVGWDAICDSENISIQAAQFRMAYEAAAKRETEMRRISPELRPAIVAGPDMTPKIHRGEVSDAVKNLANKLTPPGEGAA